MADDDEKKKKQREPKEIVVVKNTYDWQRMKLDRLMKNPDKPVQIPEKPKDKKDKLMEPPDFVRNVMGSSAGAGSGEFHVYRHIRRREYARQKTIQVMSERERKDEEFKKKLETNQLTAEERTAKKRAKRLKKKQKGGGKKTKQNEKPETSSSEEEDEEEEEKGKSEAGEVGESKTDTAVSDVNKDSSESN